MARVALLCRDLLFGSKVEGGLCAAGQDVTRFDDAVSARAATATSDVLIVDLTDGEAGGPALIGSMRQDGDLGGIRTLGFYAHVDQAVRRRAEEAGFDLVVPRSRMAREMAALVEALLAR